MLDGFPRNLAQAEALDEMLARASAAALDAILFFDIPDDGRHGARAQPRARSRTAPTTRREVIAKRLEIYHAETEPIVEHYRATGKLVPLHAERTIDEVWAEIAAALEQVEAPA